MAILWKCRDGTQIAVKDMQDSHLLHAERFVRRGMDASYAKEKAEMWAFALSPMAPSGDTIAADDLDRDLFRMEDEARPQTYWERRFLAEIKWRKLKPLE